MAHLASWVQLAERVERHLVMSFTAVGDAEPGQPDVVHGCRMCALLSIESADSVAALAEHYSEQTPEGPDPERFWSQPVLEPRSGPAGLVRDLQDLLMLVELARSTWTAVDQAAKAVRDSGLETAALEALSRNHRESAWLTTQLKAAAPQVLVMAP